MHYKYHIIIKKTIYIFELTRIKIRLTSTLPFCIFKRTFHLTIWSRVIFIEAHFSFIVKDAIAFSWNNSTRRRRGYNIYISMIYKYLNLIFLLSIENIYIYRKNKYLLHQLVRSLLVQDLQETLFRGHRESWPDCVLKPVKKYFM